MNDQRQPVEQESQQRSAEKLFADSYRRPRLLVIGSTKRKLNGHHGVGQESGGWAPKP